MVITTAGVADVLNSPGRLDNSCTKSREKYMANSWLDSLSWLKMWFIKKVSGSSVFCFGQYQYI